MRKALLVLAVVGAMMLPMGAAQADESPKIGGFGVPIPGTGCTVYTPYIYVGSVPGGPFYVGPGYVSCP